MTHKYDEELARDRESFKDSLLYPVFPILRKGLWHTTSRNGYFGIRHNGYILPNTGERPFTWPQSADSLATHQRYVALFDFESATEDQCIRHHYKWTGFFMIHRPVTVAIQLDRGPLEPKLIPNEMTREEPNFDKVWIPYVEVWYPSPIPAAMIQTYLVFSPPQPVSAVVVRANDAGHKWLDELLDRSVAVAGCQLE